MKTIAIDFDGVIHKYSKGWHDGTCYDEPIEGSFEFIWEKMCEGYSVFILSTRSPKQIKKWIDSYIIGYNEDFDERYMPQIFETNYKYGFDCKIIPFWVKFWNEPTTLGITRKKLPAIAYIDDRAVRFDGNFDKLDIS